MGLRNTGRINLGPIRINQGRDFRPTSATLRLGPMSFRLWSRPDLRSRQRRGLSSIDLPGPLSWRPDRKPARAPRSTEQQDGLF